MHHALYIEEILLNVFNYCDHPRYREGQPHFAALARTCKTFKGPALDMIWAELDDLTPLVRCLPEALWVESEGVGQSRSYVLRWMLIEFCAGLFTPKTPRAD